MRLIESLGQPMRAAILFVYKEVFGGTPLQLSAESKIHKRKLPRDREKRSLTTREKVEAAGEAVPSSRWNRYLRIPSTQLNETLLSFLVRYELLSGFAVGQWFQLSAAPSVEHSLRVGGKADLKLSERARDRCSEFFWNSSWQSKMPEALQTDAGMLQKNWKGEREKSAREEWMGENEKTRKNN